MEIKMYFNNYLAEAQSDTKSNIKSLQRVIAN